MPEDVPVEEHDSGPEFFDLQTPPHTPRALPLTPRDLPAASSMYARTFHVSSTRLADGRPSIIVDPGSVGNLCGDKWAKEIATHAHRNGKRPSYVAKDKPLKVSGVGSGSQFCNYDCQLPVAFRHADGSSSSIGELKTPAVQDSDLPGLLGLSALRRNRAIIDFTTLKLHFLGPGDITVEKALPPGSESFQMEIAPSGHIVLPCCEFAPEERQEDHTLILHTRQQIPARSQSLPPPPRRPPNLENLNQTIEEPPIPESTPQF